MSFHEILFPLEIALGSRGGPERLTDVVTLGSGHEERNQRWFHSRRRYNAGYGVKSLRDIAVVIAFFEERRGRLYGFRWRDPADHRSCMPGSLPGPLDQTLGAGDGVQTTFQLSKQYGGAFASYRRDIRKPVVASVRVAVDGLELQAAAFSCDGATGNVHLSSPPAPGAAITAGFMFDVPVRFDTDYLDMDHSAFEAGEIPNLPVKEIVE